MKFAAFGRHFTPALNGQEGSHFYRKMTAQPEAPSGRELDFRPAGEERLREPAVLTIYDCERSVCLCKDIIPQALSVAFGDSFLPEEASCLCKSIPNFTGRLSARKALSPGDDLTLR